MLAIKLKRTGKKHQAHFRLIVAEKRSKMRGLYTDDLGWLNPHTNQFNINAEKTLHWLKIGASPTNSAHNLLVKAGIVKKPKIPVHARKKESKTA